MPNASSSNINAAKRIRRGTKQYRYRNDLFYVLRHPTPTNLINYAKYFVVRSPLGRLVLIFTLLSIFHVFILSHIFWPKYLHWLHNSTTTTVTPTSEEF